DVRNFNTSWSEAESSRLARYIRDIPQGQVVALASTFDVSRFLTPEAVAALATLGVKGDLRDQFGSMHAAIGVKGAAPGTVAESLGETTAECRVGRPAPPQLSVSDI